ncbi:MAG: alpha/beta hydrolase [Pseudomonadota bacterium]
MTPHGMGQIGPSRSRMWHLDETYECSAGLVRAGRCGQGPPLVLAHGWPWSSFSWHRIIPALEDSYHLHWYDMPGFGRSQMGGPRAPALDTQGDVFAEMLNHWQLAKPLVLAHDFGGAVTLRAHLLAGRDYGHLTLMNVVAMRPWGSDFFNHVGQHTEAFLGLPQHIHAAVVEAYIKGALVTDLDKADLKATITPWISEEGQVAFYAQFALADEALTSAFEDKLADMRCPVTVLWGEDDPWIPIARGQALAQAIGTVLVPLPNVGHLPQLEAPSRVVEAIKTAKAGH